MEEEKGQSGERAMTGVQVLRTAITLLHEFAL